MLVPKGEIIDVGCTLIKCTFFFELHRVQIGICENHTGQIDSYFFFD